MTFIVYFYREAGKIGFYTMTVSVGLAFYLYRRPEIVN